MTPRTLQRRIWRPARQAMFPVLRAFDTIVQWVIPVKANRVFYASMPDYADSPYSMYRHLLDTRRDLEHVWLVRNRGLADRIRAEFVGAEARGHTLVIKRWSPTSFIDFLRSRYVIHTHGVYGFSEPKRGRTSVCVWHGMPVKAIRRLHHGDFELFPVFGTVHVATSTFFRYIIAGVFDVHPNQVLVSGLPRSDVLKGQVPPRHDRAAIAAEIGLDPGKRWILWMPTHRSEPNPKQPGASSSFIDAMDPVMTEALDEAAARHDAQVLVKLHPFDLLNDRGGELVPAHLRLLTAPQWEATGIQLYDLVAASDALITDISSIVIDYLHTGNPIGIMGYDQSDYTRDTVFDPAMLLGCAAIQALATPADVRAFVAGVDRCHGEPSGTADLSVVFNEDHEIASAAFIADAIGL